MTVSTLLVSAKVGDVDEGVLLDVAVLTGNAEGLAATRPDKPASSPSHHVGK